MVDKHKNIYIYIYFFFQICLCLINHIYNRCVSCRRTIFSWRNDTKCSNLMFYIYIEMDFCKMCWITKPYVEPVKSCSYPQFLLLWDPVKYSSQISAFVSDITTKISYAFLIFPVSYYVLHNSYSLTYSLWFNHLINVRMRMQTMKHVV